MRRLTVCILLAILSTAFLALPASGWGREGHRVSGMIAWYYLNEKAKAAVTDLLDGESLGLASNWADDIRDAHSFDWAKPLHYVNVPKTSHLGRSEPKLQRWRMHVVGNERHSLILKDAMKPRPGVFKCFFTNIEAPLEKNLHRGRRSSCLLRHSLLDVGADS